MTTATSKRRDFLKFSAGALVATALPAGVHQHPVRAQDKARSAQERRGVGAIGMRYQGTVIALQAQAHGDIVAICDVDRNVREQARASFGSTPRIFEDYRELLERPDVDVVTIGTPDHWHTKMVIDACRAGKDVYVEKPLTLTIDEGRLLTDVVRQTGRVVQVGSWQRSDHRFRLAVEMVRQGRIGRLQRIDVVLDKNPVGGPFPSSKPPGALNWDLWQGQTPEVPYIEQRCHYTFRWWEEYSGGRMTDWGAHHLDIAQWAVGAEPEQVEATARYPEVEDGYNVPIDYHATYRYPGGVVMTVSDQGRNGITFTGSEGRMFVNRGTLDGTPVDELSSQPLQRGDFVLYDRDNLDRPERVGKLDSIVNHMGNFFDCLDSGELPISDVFSQNASTNTCHMANIAMRLGRPLQWDGDQQSFVDDREANGLRRREQRSGYEVL